jgi:transcription elongation GreA/GreB family factor
VDKSIFLPVLTGRFEAAEPNFIEVLWRPADDELIGAGAIVYCQMNKRLLKKKIIARLTEELETYFRAAKASRAEATHEQSRAENKYDTRGLEASYLAKGQSRQVAELEAAIAAFEEMEIKQFGNGQAIDVGAVVEVEHRGEKTIYFIGTKAGGTEVVYDRNEVMVITPQSPLGEQLIGKKPGDRLQLAHSGNRDPHHVVSVI